MAVIDKETDSTRKGQTILCFLNWLPLFAGLLFCVLFKDIFLHADFVSRLFKYGIPPVISLFTCFGIATLCFQKGSRELSTILFGLICTLWGMLSLDVALLIVIKDVDVALKISRIDHFFLVMQLGLYIHFLYYFAGINKKWVYLAYTASFFFAPVSQTDWYIRNMYSYPWGFFAEKNFMFDFFSIIAGFAIIMTGYVLIVRAFKSTDNLRKKQFLFFLTGSVGEVILSLTNVPAMSGLDFYPCGSFIFIPVLLMTYGAFRHDIIKFNVYTKKRVVFHILRLFTFSIYVFMATAFVFFAGGYSNGYIISKIIPSGLLALFSFVLCLFFSGVATRLGQNRGTIRLFGVFCLLHAFLCLNSITGLIIVGDFKIQWLRSIDYCLLLFLPGLQLQFIFLVCQKNEWFFVFLSYLFGIIISIIIIWDIFFIPVDLNLHILFSRNEPALITFIMIFVVTSSYCLKLLYSYRIEIKKTIHYRSLHYFIIGFLFLALLALGNIYAVIGKDFFPFVKYSFIPLSLMGYSVFRQNKNEVLGVLNNFLQSVGYLSFLIITALILFELKFIDLPFWYYFFGLLIWVLFVRYGGGLFSTLLAYLLDREKEQLSAALNETSVELATTHTVETIFKVISKPLFKELSCLGFCVLIPDEEQFYYSGWEILNNKKERLSPFSNGTDNSAKAIEISFSKDHKLIKLAERYFDLLPQAVFEEMIIQKDIILPADDKLRNSEILCPVYFNDEMICLIALYDKYDGTDYSGNEAEFISKLSLILGPYLENARLLTGLEKEVEQRTHDLREVLSELTVVNSIVSTVNSTLDLDEVMLAFIRHLEAFIEFEMISIQLIEKSVDELCLYRVYGNALSENKRNRLEALSISLQEKESLFLKVIDDKTVVYQNDYCIETVESFFEKQIYSEIPFRTILVLPMEFQNEIIGSVLITSGVSGTDYSKDDIEKIGSFVTLISSAVNNSQLYKKVESALAVKRDFIARMSHEIRTPLNAILAMGELLDETDLSLEQKEYVAILKNTGSLLLKILSEILDFSKLEAGKLTLDTASFNLPELLDNIETIVSASLLTKSLTYRCIVEGEIGSVFMGDYVKLSQILINLITNSIKFTPEGFITVSVKRSSTKDMLEFSVEDTGVGIPLSEQSTIFESFTQVHDSQGNFQGGSGLGLSISKKIIELMGGQIRLETCEESGSRFVFTVSLPASIGPDTETLNVVSDHMITGLLNDSNIERQDENNAICIQGIHALIVEDTYTNQVVLQKYLDSSGVIYETADNGNAAFEKFKEQKFDIILMDIEMPGMDGFTTAEKIRDWEIINNLNQTPILAISAHVQPENEAISDGSLMNDFLLKPYKKKRLLDKIKKLLGEGDAINVKVGDYLIDVVPELMKEIRTELQNALGCLENGDYNAIEILAHGLRGASFNCELRYLGGLFKNLKKSVLLKNNKKTQKNIKIILDYIKGINIEYVKAD